MAVAGRADGSPAAVALAVGVDAPDFTQPAAINARLTVSALAPSFKIIFIELLTLVSDFPFWPGEGRPASTQAKVYTMLSPNLNHSICRKFLVAQAGWAAFQGVRAPQRHIKAPGKIMLDLSTTLGEYSGLENTPLSSPSQIHRGRPVAFVERVDESDHL